MTIRAIARLFGPNSIIFYGKISSICSKVDSFIWWPLPSADKILLATNFVTDVLKCSNNFVCFASCLYRNNPSVVGITRNTGRLHCEVRKPVLLMY